jgi:protein-L-isoaspartate(D-aspartate) O-methyltransferase
MTLDYGAARENMVENQVRTNDVTDHAVQDAMRAVARESVCLPGKAHLAYAEADVEYAPGYFLLQPREVSKLLQAVRPRAGERALAISAPYAAMVLNRIGLDVRLRLAPEVEAAPAIAQSGIAVVNGALTAADDAASFDLILVEGAVDRTPDSWTAMLRIGGRLGVVERDGPVGRARLYVRGPDGSVAGRTLFDATPPMLPGFSPAPAFQF